MENPSIHKHNSTMSSKPDDEESKIEEPLANPLDTEANGVVEKSNDDVETIPQPDNEAVAVAEETVHQDELPPPGKKIRMKVDADAPWLVRLWEVFTTFWPLGLVSFSFAKFDLPISDSERMQCTPSTSFSFTNLTTTDRLWRSSSARGYSERSLSRPARLA